MKLNKHISSWIILCLVLVQMMESCTSEKAPEPIDCNSNPVNIQSITSSEATCGLDDGTLTITANGGSGDFMYSINGTDFQAQNTFQNLIAGNYSVIVKDVNECTATGSGIVESSAGITVNAEVTSEAGCDTNNGVISVSASGGQSPYQYRLADGSYQEEGSFSDLVAGTYIVFAQDGNGCETSTSVDIIAGTSLDTDVMPIITNSCAVSGCHDGNSGIPDWTNKNNVIMSAANIKTRTGNGTMPPGDRSITDEEIQNIACWVDDGAENN